MRLLERAGVGIKISGCVSASIIQIDSFIRAQSPLLISLLERCRSPPFTFPACSRFRPLRMILSDLKAGLITDPSIRMSNGPIMNRLSFRSSFFSAFTA